MSQNLNFDRTTQLIYFQMNGKMPGAKIEDASWRAFFSTVNFEVFRLNLGYCRGL